MADIFLCCCKINFKDLRQILKLYKFKSTKIGIKPV